MATKLYQQLISQITDDINAGVLQPGQRMLSVRALCQQKAVSKSTVLTAYSLMQSTGLLESRPRSGYFVSSKSKHKKLPVYPSVSNPESTPVSVATDQVILTAMEQGASLICAHRLAAMQTTSR
jgi:DNA-binding GntR family transcriptional regulator